MTKENLAIGEMTMGESKRDRFQRIAEARTNKIIDMIRLLGNCSNRANYDYDADDVKQVFDAIESELAEAKARYKMSDTPQNRFAFRRSKR